MKEKINDFIELVEDRIFELALLIKDARDGKSSGYCRVSDLESLLKINEDMLLCLRAYRDFEQRLSLSKALVANQHGSSGHRLLRSVFPFDHPLYGRDNEFGETILA